MITDHFGIGQIQVIHDSNEFVETLGQSRIVLEFFGDGGDHSSVVIVRRVKLEVFRQLEYH